MRSVTIKIPILKVIHSFVNSTAMDKEAIQINIVNKKVLIKDKNHEDTVIFALLSEEQIADSEEEITIPIVVKDLKSIIDLADNEDITFEVDKGTTICKVGKIRRKIPQPIDVDYVAKKFKIDYKASIQLSNADIKYIAKALKTDESASVKLSARTSGEFILSVDCFGRNTEVRFDGESLKDSKIEEDVDIIILSEYFLPLFRAKTDDAVFTINIVNNKPVKLSLDSDIYKAYMYIAPSIAGN